MEKLNLFLNLLNVNLKNIGQNLGDVCECAVKEGGYAADVIGTMPDGSNAYLAIAFEPVIAPAWNNPPLYRNEHGEYITQDEFMDQVLDAVNDLVEGGALDKDIEETFDGGLGI